MGKNKGGRIWQLIKNYWISLWKGGIHRSCFRKMVFGSSPKTVLTGSSKLELSIPLEGHLEELYGIDVSPDLISTVTDAVLETVTEWQNRALDPCYPIVFFDAIRVKIRPGEDPPG